MTPIYDERTNIYGEIRRRRRERSLPVSILYSKI
jgi:hypothetical protein